MEPLFLTNSLQLPVLQMSTGPVTVPTDRPLLIPGRFGFQPGQAILQSETIEQLVGSIVGRCRAARVTGMNVATQEEIKLQLSTILNEFWCVNWLCKCV